VYYGYKTNYQCCSWAIFCVNICPNLPYFKNICYNSTIGCRRLSKHTNDYFKYIFSCGRFLVWLHHKIGKRSLICDTWHILGSSKIEINGNSWFDNVKLFDIWDVILSSSWLEQRDESFIMIRTTWHVIS
jgi:hypothetical protein